MARKLEITADKRKKKDPAFVENGLHGENSLKNFHSEKAMFGASLPFEVLLR